MFDVFGMSRVLIRSITLLCEADHGNDPQNLAEWTVNKDPASIREWLARGAKLWVALHDGQFAAVGGIRADEITLLYTDPDHIGCGIGQALLHRLEHEIAAEGHSEARLEATRTAQDFYKRNRWSATGQCRARGEVTCFAMHKSMQPSD
ncbi:MAG: GNAT family N-acetyltransferase [Ruegeria sp.]